MYIYVCICIHLHGQVRRATRRLDVKQLVDLSLPAPVCAYFMMESFGSYYGIIKKIVIKLSGSDESVLNKSLRIF